MVDVVCLYRAVKHVVFGEWLMLCVSWCQPSGVFGIAVYDSTRGRMSSLGGRHVTVESVCIRVYPNGGVCLECCVEFPLELASHWTVEL